MNDFRAEAVALYREMSLSIQDERNLEMIQKALQDAARGADLQLRDAEAQRDHLIDGIREAMTLLQYQPSTVGLCAVAKAIQDGVTKMDAVAKKR